MSDLLRCFEAVKHFADPNTIFDSILQKWPVIEEIVNILRVPFETTTALESSTLTLSDLFGALLKMEFKMQKLKSNPDRLTDLAEILFEKVSTRKAKLIMNPAMLCAVYLDPRYCLDLNSNEMKIAKLTLENFHEKWKHRCEILQVDTASTSRNDSFEEFQAAKRKRSALITSEKNRPSSEANLMLLFEKYENELPEMHHRDSILAHWQSRKETDPVLYRLASMINTIPPTQVTVERSFSILGLVYNCRRTQLSPDLLQHLLLININKELVPGINAQDLAKLKAE